MPRKSEGARLYRRPDKRGAGTYEIRDGSRRISTRTSDRRRAEEALARYIAERGRPTTGPRDPAQVTVAEALEIYATERAPLVRDPARIGDCIRALVPILGALPLSSITGEVCRRYGKARDRAPGTIRKELGTLAAAINHCHAEGYITAAPRVRLPAKPTPRDRWLTRDEAAKLVRAAYRNPKAKAPRPLHSRGALHRHEVRRDPAAQLHRRTPSADGWTPRRGVLYRRAAGRRGDEEADPARTCPAAPLLAHLRRWERQGGPFRGRGRTVQRVGSLKTAWRTALAASGIDHCTKHDLRHTADHLGHAEAVPTAGTRPDSSGLRSTCWSRPMGIIIPEHVQSSAVEAINRRA